MFILFLTGYYFFKDCEVILGTAIQNARITSIIVILHENKKLKSDG